MSTQTIDKNGIWVDNTKVVVDYPDIGNNNSFTLEENSFWFAHRNKVILETIKRYPFHKNYADIGGGNGFQTKFIQDNFPKSKAYLIEPGYQGCLNARKRGLSDIYNITAQNFDFKSNDVTAVGLFDVIEHIENDSKFLIQLKNKLPAGSLIYITVPTYNFLWSDVDDLGRHHRRYTIKMIKKLCLSAGVELQYASYFFSYIPPLTFFLRSIPYRINGYRGQKKILEKEDHQHNPSPFILKIFDYFQQREIKKIKHSKTSFGASCIAVLKT